MNMIRLLRADEIECRVSTISEKGVSLLLYKDARVDQRILDETFTPLGWQRTHQSIDGNLYCTVEIWDDAKKCESIVKRRKRMTNDAVRMRMTLWKKNSSNYTAPFANAMIADL